jgi:hypothetical protein
MSLNIADYRSELIDKILSANSHNEVQTFIYQTVKELKNDNVYDYIIRRFLDNTKESLQNFKPADYNSQQNSNVKIAKIALDQFKASVSQVVSGENNKIK